MKINLNVKIIFQYFYFFTTYLILYKSDGQYVYNLKLFKLINLFNLFLCNSSLSKIKLYFDLKHIILFINKLILFKLLFNSISYLLLFFLTKIYKFYL